MIAHSLLFIINSAIAFFFLLLGLLSLLIPWSKSTREQLLIFLQEQSLALTFLGLILIVIGISLAAQVILAARRKYYVISSSTATIEVDEDLLNHCLRLYWEQTFPHREIPHQLTIKNNQLHFAVELPHFPLDQQHQLLQRIKEDLRNLLSNIGYRDEFHIKASFPKKNKESANLTS